MGQERLACDFSAILEQHEHVVETRVLYVIAVLNEAAHTLVLAEAEYQVAVSAVKETSRWLVKSKKHGFRSPCSGSDEHIVIRMRRALFIFLLLLPGISMPGNETVCPDAGVLSGKLITDVCWSCMFPVRIMGAEIGGGNAPDGASGNVLCACDDNLGLPHPGWVMGLWEPARLVELVTFPGCSPSLGGIRLPLSDERHLGTAGSGDYDHADLAFYHYHYYAFPLLGMLDLWMPGRCNNDGFADMDLLYLSELDPTWNSDELAFFTNPEAAAVADPMAITACAADAASAAAGKPIDKMWWCAGSWGTLYPFSGHTANSGMVEDTSILATKAVAALHRRGLEWRTMGNDALCGGYIDPMLPKSQYKWSMFFPSAEADDAHVIGESEFQWGLGRMIPGVGEDAVYMLWRWNDCCVTF